MKEKGGGEEEGRGLGKGTSIARVRKKRMSSCFLLCFLSMYFLLA